MGFLEDELAQKTRDLEVEARVFAQRRSIRRKYLMWTLLIVALIGGTVAYLQLTSTSENDPLTSGPEYRRSLVEKWKKVGLIKHLDTQSSICTISDEQWNILSEGEKKEIGTTLGGYCADINKDSLPRITIQSYFTRGILLQLNTIEVESPPPAQSPDRE